MPSVVTRLRSASYGGQARRYLSSPPTCPGHVPGREEAGVHAAANAQFVVRPALHDSTLVHHQDDIDIANGRHPVRDNEGGAAGEQPVESFEDEPFGLQIET